MYILLEHTVKYILYKNLQVFYYKCQFIFGKRTFEESRMHFFNAIKIKQRLTQKFQMEK
jgi:hypothetical protein